MDLIDINQAVSRMKRYTDSQRIAYVEGQKTITFDGNSDGKECISELLLVKVSDLVYDLSKATFVTQRLPSGEDVAIEASAFDFVTEDGMRALVYNDTVAVFSLTENTAGDYGVTCGTFVLCTYETWISKVEFAETIHPIDPKYLPGVCLPVVELTTTVANDAAFTDEEKAALTSCLGMPCVIKYNGAAELFNYAVDDFPLFFSASGCLLVYNDGVWICVKTG